MSFLRDPTAGSRNFSWITGGDSSITHVAIIGNGAFGEVHKLKEVNTGRLFARKALRPFGIVTHEDIANEARTISAVCAPGLCRYVVEVHRHDWLPDSSYYFIDMELCDLTLEDRIKEMGRTMVQEIRELELDFVREQNSVAETVETPPEATRERIPSVQSDEISGSTTPAESNANPTPADEIDWEPVMDILDDMTSGLIYIHGKNIVHRDLKPRNVLFSSRQHCWKLADFGSASLATSKKLVTTSLGRGTEGYRAPEVLRTRGHYNKRSDIFALGCITYEIVTGQKLFDSDWDVIEYARNGLPLYPTKWPPCKTGTRLLQLGEFTSMLTSADPVSRPGTKATAQQLRFIRRGNQESEEADPPGNPPEDDDENEVGSDQNPAAFVSNPVVQPSLRVDGGGKKRSFNIELEEPNQQQAPLRHGYSTESFYTPPYEGVSFGYRLPSGPPQYELPNSHSPRSKSPLLSNYQAQSAGQNFAEVPKTQANPPIVSEEFHERNGHNSGFDDERVPTVVLKRTRRQSVVIRGNNRFGSKGTLACQYCRRHKQKCMYDQQRPDNVCAWCLRRALECGPKLSREEFRQQENIRNKSSI